MKRYGLAGIIIAIAAINCQLTGAEIDQHLSRIKAVGREGAGNEAAALAWRELIQMGPWALPAILGGMDDADKTAANWLRTVVDTIVQQSLRNRTPLPVAELEKFVKDLRHDPAARRLAFELLGKVDANAPERLLPDMLQDPSIELRRDAVERVLKDAQKQLDKGDKQAAKTALTKALTGARDKDQVEQIAKQLKLLGVEVDLNKHFGFIRNWFLAGPFDNSEQKGFAGVFAPETKLELNGSMIGKKDAKIEWKAAASTDPYGMVDFNKQIGKHMSAVGYAFAEVESPTAMPVQLRVGSQNAVKIYLNGKELFYREAYHHGLEMDQHVAAGQLQPGRNAILVKVCQNEMKEPWAQAWSFQLRVCDAVGSAIPVKVVDKKEKP